MKRRYPQLSEHHTARAHRGIAPRFPTISADLSGGSVNLIPFFSSYFPVFDTLNAIRALRAGWRKRYPVYAFLLTRMMYTPQLWDMPPPPPPGYVVAYRPINHHSLCPLSYASTCSDSGVARICKRGAKAREQSDRVWPGGCVCVCVCVCVWGGGGGVERFLKLCVSKWPFFAY